MVRGDRQRLVQLLDNLMQNSIRYTDPGGSIKVSMDRHSDDVLIAWQDSAPGVSDAHEGHIEAVHSPLGGLAIHIRLPIQSTEHA